MNEPAPLPTGARPLTVDDYLAAIGELYLQTRLLRLTLAQLASPPEAANVVEKSEQRNGVAL